MRDDKLYTKKFVFTVEGETEKWYLEWLRDQINTCKSRNYNVALDVKVQQSPKKFYKSANAKAAPEVFHICDVESSDPVHIEKLQSILSEMKEAKTQKTSLDIVISRLNFGWCFIRKTVTVYWLIAGSILII